MINIQVNSNISSSSIWGAKLLYHLTQHENISTKITTLPQINVYRHTSFTPLIYNDTIFIIDDWDYETPTSLLVDNKNIIPNFYLDNQTVILKVQYSNKHQHIYDFLYKTYNIKVLPFTMFANSKFYLNNFLWDHKIIHKYNCIFTGKPWRCRKAWINFAEKHYLEIGCNQKFCFLQGGEVNKQSAFDSFYQILSQTKWGVILKGKGEGGKNRREVEYSSLGMPLAMNYIPEYPFPFVPDEDFLFLKEPKDLLKLSQIDPEPFAKKSYNLYNQYFSPKEGVYNSFKLVYELAKPYSSQNSINHNFITDKNIKTISANTPYHFGKMNKGNSINIQYISGSWKSWGRSGRGFVNPDLTNGRGNDRARLAIYSKDHKNNKKHICLVPENTKNNPYLFYVNDDMNLYFCMNNFGRYPRGQVKYKISIL